MFIAFRVSDFDHRISVPSFLSSLLEWVSLSFPEFRLHTASYIFAFLSEPKIADQL